MMHVHNVMNVLAALLSTVFKSVGIYKEKAKKKTEEVNTAEYAERYYEQQKNSSSSVTITDNVTPSR